MNKIDHKYFGDKLYLLCKCKLCGKLFCIDDSTTIIDVQREIIEYASHANCDGVKKLKKQDNQQIKPMLEVIAKSNKEFLDADCYLRYDMYYSRILCYDKDNNVIDEDEV
jgi:hypothetical protein